MSDYNENGEVRSVVDGHILHITVDRATKLNGFTPEMFDALSTALTRLDEDADLWVGVIDFAGETHNGRIGSAAVRGIVSQATGAAAVDDRVDAFALRRRCRKPVVMAVQGITFTIGIEMLLVADIVIAADDCRFCQMEPKRGLAVLGGAHVRYVQRAGWGNAMYHLLRADEFDAARARELGFVQEVVPAGTQLERARAIAREICDVAPLAVQEIKRGALKYLEEGERAALAEIPAMRARTAQSADFGEGLASFRENVRLDSQVGKFFADPLNHLHRGQRLS